LQSVSCRIWKQASISKNFEQNFVCLVARDHPRITSSLSKRAFLREGHVLIKSSGTGHSIVERTMEKENIVRKIVLQAPSFLSVARIVAQTEFIATVPERYGSASAAQEKIKLFRSPVKLPSYSVKQHWHERFHRDSANGWLRQVMRQLFVD
jgi:DNA-binding transcriptional LysR family regulator